MIKFMAILFIAGQMNKIDVHEEERLRNCIYNKKPEYGEVKGLGGIPVYFIIVPKEIKALYEKKPAPTLIVLVSIVEGANPKESCLAAAYAVTLMGTEGFSGFIIYNDLLDPSEYEKLKPNDKNTWRRHWVKTVQFDASKKKIDLTFKELGK